MVKQGLLFCLEGPWFILDTWEQHTEVYKPVAVKKHHSFLSFKLNKPSTKIAVFVLDVVMMYSE
jgi:hypothetical protein